MLKVKKDMALILSGWFDSIQPNALEYVPFNSNRNIIVNTNPLISKQPLTVSSEGLNILHFDQI